MEFKVIFYRNNHYEALNIPTHTVGFGLLGKMREKAHPRHLYLRNVKEEVRGIKLKEYSITLPEEEARTTGLFEESSTVRVRVSKDFLNKYTSLQIKIDGEGPLCHAEAYYEIRNSALIQDWRGAGFPLGWEE